MTDFTAAELRTLAEEHGMVFGDHVLGELVAALDAGKHVMLTGSPGTGKTTLAYLAAELGRRSMLCNGSMAVTASSEWDSHLTIGSMVPSPEGNTFQPGVFLQAIELGQWLVIDELNRADFDRAFGPLFTVLAGQSVTLPYRRSSFRPPIAIVPHGGEEPVNADVVRVPHPWRMIATMNVFDRDLLYRLSYALMRRFAFIEVDSPDDEVIRQLVEGPGQVVASLIPIRQLIELGPALFVDAARYAARRLEDDVSPSRVLFEVFRSYFLPQLDSLQDAEVGQLYELIAPAFDTEEEAAYRKLLRTALGSGAHGRPAASGIGRTPERPVLEALGSDLAQAV